MTTNQMREKILEVYPKWLEIGSMSDGRIQAIFFNMQKRDAWNTKVKENPTDVKYAKDKQLSIFDIWSKDELFGGNDNGKN